MLDYDMGEAVGALRKELRDLVREHVPPDFLGALSDDPTDLEVAQRFCRLLAERGLLCIAWPEEFGGRGASAWEQAAVREEMWAHFEPRGPQYMGVNWVGPAIMRRGNEEQRRTHLPPIARGEVIWCQGFSEPNAGSDLASLQTAARRDGDGWRISGQKISRFEEEPRLPRRSDRLLPAMVRAAHARPWETTSPSLRRRSGEHSRRSARRSAMLQPGEFPKDFE